MKVVMVGPAYPMRGGIAQSGAILFNELSKKHDVTFFSFKRQYPSFLFPGQTQLEEGEDVFHIPAERSIIAVDSINPFNWLRTGWRIAKQKPDAVIFKYWMPFFAPCYFVIAFIANLFFKTRIIFLCDNILPHERMLGDKLLTRILFSTADAFMVLSGTVEKELQEFRKNKPYRLSPHPLYNVFGEKVSKDQAKTFLKEHYRLSNLDGNVMLFFGFIRKYKGLNYLLDAMPEVLKKHQVKLLVVGEFYEDEKPYREQVQLSGIRNSVDFVSQYVPNEHIRYFFSAADVMVLPYVSASQSGIIQIAYNYDVPVISTRVGGLAEVVIEGKTGLLVPAENSPELSAAINHFYEDQLEQNFISHIREEKKKYSWEGLVKKLEELLPQKLV